MKNHCYPCFFFTIESFSLPRIPWEHVRGKLPQLTGRSWWTSWWHQAANICTTTHTWNNWVQTPHTRDSSVHWHSLGGGTSAAPANHKFPRDKPQQQTWHPAANWTRKYPHFQISRCGEHRERCPLRVSPIPTPLHRSSQNGELAKLPSALSTTSAAK